MLMVLRDVYAAFFLEKQLSLLRERFLVRSLEGPPPDPDFWSREEATIASEEQRVFFDRAMRALLRPSTAPELIDAQDFEERSQKLLEEAIFMTHRLLVQMPFVGQAEYQDH